MQRLTYGRSWSSNGFAIRVCSRPYRNRERSHERAPRAGRAKFLAPFDGLNETLRLPAASKPNQLKRVNQHLSESTFVPKLIFISSTTGRRSRWPQ
jgi:hypothetical protein